MKVILNILYEDIAIWFAATSSSAAAVGLFFNAWQMKMQSKSNYFLTFKELEDEYNKIDSRTFDVKDYVLLPHTELKKNDDQIIAKTTQFKRDHVQFHEKLAYLYYAKIIPKNIPEFFDVSFSHSLFLIETSNRKDEIKKQVNNLLRWCKENNILPKQPFEMKTASTNS